MSSNPNPLPSSLAPAPAAPKPVLVPTPEEPKRPAWIVWGGLGLLVVLGLGGWRWWQARQDEQARALMPAIHTATAQMGNLQQVVRLSGTISSRNFINVTAPKLTGPEGNRPMIILEMVPNGSMVKKGQKILTIDGQSLADHVEDVNSTVVQSQSDITKRNAEQKLDYTNLEQDIRVAKSELDKAQLDLKTRELRTPFDQELLQLNVDETDARYKQLVRELELRKQSQRSELRILEFTTQRHTRHRDRHKSDLKKFTVYASMDGMAVMSTVWRGGEMDAVKVGDLVYPGQPVIKIVDPRNMQIEGNLNQSEISQFRLGQPAEIQLDAFPGAKFTGKIYSIGALAVGSMRQQNFIRTVPVRVAVDGFEPRLIPDLSASANILIGASDKASLLVPRGALHEENGKTYVYAKSGNTFVRKEVSLGEANQTQVTVLSGLNPGEEVALNYTPPADPKSEQQVASR